MDGRAVVRGWKAALYLRDELLQVAMIAPALEQGPVNAQTQLVKNFEKTQPLGSLPQISVPDISLSANNNEAAYRILRGQQIGLHILIPVVVKQKKHSHAL